MNESRYNKAQNGTLQPTDDFELALYTAYELANSAGKETIKKSFPYYFGKTLDVFIATGYAYSKGDPSVGIQPQEYSFQLHRENISNPDEREAYRRSMQKLYRDVSDEVVSVIFDDESDESSDLMNKQREANQLIDLEHKISSSVVPFLMDVSFSTDGDDYEEQYQYFQCKLEIIRKYFPFQSVHGTMDCARGVNLGFDNGLKFDGKYHGDPLLVTMTYIGHHQTVNFHPFGDMGEFNAEAFEASIRRALSKIVSDL